MSNILLRVVSQEDVAEIFKGNSNVIFRIVEDAFKKYLEGTVLFPDKYRKYLICNLKIELIVCQRPYLQIRSVG